MLLLSHPTINGVVRHTAHALSRAGVLGEFWTCLRTPEQTFLRCVPAGALLDAATAAHDACNAEAPAPPDIASAPFPDISPACSLDHAMSERVDSERFGGVYAYEEGADETFRAAGRQGLLRVYDLPHGLWRGPNPILEEEAAREPEWASTLQSFRHTAASIARTESELLQADLILVGSSFGLQTVERSADVPGTIALMAPAPACILPVGAMANAATGTTDRLRVLFAGPLGQKAGLSYLFAACREFGPSISLTVIGDIPPVSCPRLERELLSVRWLPSCSGEALIREMAAHDVFLFPAIFDGSSDLLLTAMSVGLPIIATAHSAAPDLIRNGEDGYIVPIRSTSVIAEKLDILRRDPALRQQMSSKARQRAQDYTWERFEQKVAASVAAALGRR